MTSLLTSKTILLVEDNPDDVELTLIAFSHQNLDNHVGDVVNIYNIVCAEQYEYGVCESVQHRHVHLSRQPDTVIHG